MLAASLFLGAGTARAQCGALGSNVINWAATSGNWSAGTNWDLGCPAANSGGYWYDVVINSSGNTITYDNGATTVDTLTLGSGTTLQALAGNVESLTIGSYNAAGVLANYGTINWGDGTATAQTLTLDISQAGAGANITELNAGQINLNGSGASLVLNDSGNASTFTFAGGGIITLTGASINGASADETLNNVDNTISGQGTISNLTVINGVNGSIVASGGNLVLQPGTGQTITNNGVFAVNSGSLLHVAGALINFSGSTLVGGSYFVHSTAALAGTLQIDSLGNTGGEILSNNANNITLDGPNSSIVDAAGLDALTLLATNIGSFTLANGRNFTTAAPTFTNNGALYLIGTPQTMTVNNFTGGVNSYVEVDSGSNILVNGTFNDINASGQLASGAFYYLPGGNLTYSGSDITQINAGSGMWVEGAGGLVNTNGGAHDPLTILATNNGELVLGFGHNLDTTAAVSAFTNNGFLMLTGSPTTLTVNEFNNTVTVEVDGGSTLIVAAGKTFDNVDASGNLNYGTFTLGGNITYDGADINTIGGNATLILDGTTGTTGGMIGTSNPSDNHLAPLATNNGALVLQNGATFTTASDFTSNNYLNSNSGSTLTVSGSLFNGGTVIVDAATMTVAGDFNNNSAWGESATVSDGGRLGVGGNFSNGFNSSLTLSGSTLTVGSNFWQDTNSSFSVLSGSTATITGVFNNQNVAYNGSGESVLVDSSELTVGSDVNNIGSGSVFTVQNGGILSVGGNFNNNNSSNFNVTSGAAATITGALNNAYGGGSGTVNVDAATLTVNGDFNNNGNPADGWNTGDNYLNETNGGHVTVGGNFNNGIYSGSSYAYGFVTLSGGSVLNVTGSFTNAGESNYGRLTLSGPGNAATFGAFQNSGSLQVDTGSTLTGGQWLDLSADGTPGDLVNGGTYNLNGGQFFYTTDYNGATGTYILNNVNATIYLTANGALTVDANGSDVLFSNDGGVTSALDYLNTNSGAIYLNGITQNVQGSLTNYGTLSLVNGSGMTVGNAGPGTGSLTNTNANVSLTNSTMTVNGGYTNQNSGFSSSSTSLNASTATVNGDFTNQNTSGWDTISTTLSSGSNLTVNGNFTNSSAYLYSYGSTLSVTGSFNNNSADLLLYGAGNIATLGAFANNSGTLEVDAGSTLTTGVWANLSADGTTGDLTGASNYYLNGGQFLYTNDANGNPNVGVLNNVNNAFYLYNATGATLSTDAIGSAILVSYDNGVTSALDNLAANGGTVQLGYQGYSASGIVQNLNGGLTNTGNLYLYNGSSMTTNCMGSAGCAGPGATGGDLTNGGATGNGSVLLQNDFGDVADGNTLTVNGNYEQNTTQLIGSNNTLTVTGNFTNDNTVRVDTGSAIGVTGTLTNVDGSGNLNGGTWNLNGGTISYSGHEIDNINGAALTLSANGGTFATDGSGSTVMLSNDGGTTSALDNLNAITNSTVTFAGITQNVSGPLTNVSTGSSSSTFNLDSSTMTVNGGFTNTNNGWGASTSLSASTMTVNGDFTNTSNPSWGDSANVTLSSGSTLNVTGNFSNANYSGGANFELSGGGNTATIGGAFTNTGYVQVDTDSAINVTGGLTNVDATGDFTGGGTLYLNGGTFFYNGNPITNIDSGTTVTLRNYGSLPADFNGSTIMLSADGGITSALDGLNTINGRLNLYNGVTQNVVGGLAVNSTGILDIEDGSNMAVMGGDLNVSGQVTMNTGDTMTISAGNLVINSGGSYVENNSDHGSAVGLIANGTFELLNGSTFTLTGPWAQLTNAGELTAGTYNFQNSTFQYNNPAINTIVTIDSGVSLTVGGSALITPDGTTNALTTLAANNGSLTINNYGTLTTIGALTNGGTLTVDSGAAMTTGGDVTNAAGALIQVAPTFNGGNSSLTVGGNFSNAVGATVNLGNSWGNGGSVGAAHVSGNFDNAGTFNLLYYGSADMSSLTNEDTGSIELYSSGTLTVTGPDGSFANYNSGSNTLTGGTYVIGGVFQVNGGINIINIASGTSLTMSGGGLITPDGSTNGLANLASNAGFLDFSNANFTTVGDFTNTGTFQLDGSNNTFATQGVFNNSGGTVNLNGSYQTLSTTSDFTNAGTLNEGGSYNSINVPGNFNNLGNVNLGGYNYGYTALSVGGDFNNNAGSSLSLGYYYETVNVAGNFNNSGNVSLNHYYDSINVTGDFNNHGGAMLSIALGNGWPSQVMVAGNLTNAGTIGVNYQGSLITAGLTNYDASTNTLSGGTYSINGLFEVTSGLNILNIGSGTTVQLWQNGLMTPDGTTDALAGLNSNAGTLDLESRNYTFTPVGGTLTNSGNLFLNGSYSTTSVSGNFNNTGTTTVTGYDENLNVTGTLTNSGTLNFNSDPSYLVLSSLNNTIGGLITVNDGDYLVLVPSGPFNNDGSVVVGSGSGATFQLQGNGAIFDLTSSLGTGTMTLNNSTITGYYGNETFINDTGHTILGSGLIHNLTLVNNGTIGAVGANPLLLQSLNSPTTNAGTLEAFSGGTLNINGGSYNNAGGTIQALGGNGSGGNSTVQLYGSVTISGGTLNTTADGTGSGIIVGYNATLDGTTNALTNAGQFLVPYNNYDYLRGAIHNTGNFQVNGGSGYDTRLYVPSNTTLTGGGTVTLNTTPGGGNAYLQLYGGTTLDNVGNTIQGDGYIYNSGATFINEPGGTVNANSTGSAAVPYLVLEYGSVINGGLMEATNSGGLHLYDTTVNNAGGNITANGGSAYVYFYGGSDVQGGTLSNNGGLFLGTPMSNGAYLDGSTAAGAITLNGTYTTDLNASTYLYGTFHNNGTFLVNGGNGYNTSLYAPANVTLDGGGTVNLATVGGGGNAYLEPYNGSTFENVNNTIQGAGIIYNSGTTLENDANGTINANSAAGFGLDLRYGLFINGGLMEATGNGVLGLNDTVVNNAGGNITANGANAVVEAYNNTTIEGGTLNTLNGGTLETYPHYAVYLDGSTNGPLTLSSGSTYTVGLGSDTYFKGTISNQGTFQVNGGSGYNTYLEVGPGAQTSTLQGGGTISLNTAVGGGNAQLYLDGGSTLENVDNTIQGNGVIYNPGTTVKNDASGAINANSASGFGLDLENGTFVNGGLIEATGNGVLGLNNTVVNNAGGNITANGAGAVVEAYNSTTIQGGTLNTLNGGTLETYPHYTVYLDGSASGALTLSSGSTYTIGLGSDTYVRGTIVNQGSFLVNGGGGYNTYFEIPNQTTTLQGGGTLTLYTVGGGGAAQLYVDGGGTLNNVNNTIQGVGTIQNGGTFNNGGTIMPGYAVGAPAPLPAGTPGTINLNGNYHQTSTGTFNELISSTTFGILNASGTATLDSGAAITVTLLGGWDPANGTTYDFLTFGALAGSSTQLTITDPFFGAGNDQMWVLNFFAGYDQLEAVANTAAEITATWTTVSGSWTNAAEWSCTAPAPANCVPDNGGGYNYDAGLNSPGNTLTLSSGNNVTVNTLALNGGTLDIESGASLNLANQPAGITDIPSGAGLVLAGTFTTGGTTSALAGLTSVEGTLYLENGQATSITPGGTPATLTNTGNFGIGGGTSVTVNGNVNNSYYLTTGYFVGGGNNTLDITGTLTNTNQFYVYGTGDQATVNVLNNTGEVFVNTGATLTVTNGITDVPAGSSIYNYGTINGLDGLTSIEGFVLLGDGQNISVTPGGSPATLTLASGGEMQVRYGTDLTVNGTVNNAGGIYLYDSGTVANFTTLLNPGTTYIGGGTTLNLTNGITDLPGTLEVYGTINSGGSFALAGLTSVEGGLYLANGQTLSITPGGTPATLTNTGIFAIGGGTNATVNGDVANSYYLTTSYFVGGGNNVLDITGTLTNTNQFYVWGGGDQATVNALNNSGEVYVNGGATLNVTSGMANLTGNSSLYDLGTVNVGSLANAGYIQVSPGASLNITGSTDTNSGNLYLLAGTLSSPSGLGSFDNTGTVATYPGYSPSTISIGGTLTNESGATFTLNNSGDVAVITTMANSGSVFVGHGASLTAADTFTQSGSGATLQVNGTLTAVTAFIDGGTVSGSGTITASLLNMGGNVMPVDPGTPSKLTVNSYIQGSTGTLTIDINGLGSSNLSLLDVLGSASLDGNVTFDFGFTPSAGETFTFLTAGNLTGIFATDTFNGFGCATCSLDYNYTNGTVTLDINGSPTVPEPSTWLTLGTALLAIAVVGALKSLFGAR